MIIHPRALCLLSLILTLSPPGLCRSLTLSLLGLGGWNRGALDLGQGPVFLKASGGYSRIGPSHVLSEATRLLGFSRAGGGGGRELQLWLESSLFLIPVAYLGTPFPDPKAGLIYRNFLPWD